MILLDRIVEGHKLILGEKLVGIYLHGSLAMGAYNPSISDIDYIIIVNENLSIEEKRKTIDFLLDLSLDGPAKGIEMSILSESDLEVSGEGLRFILHYSPLHKEKYENDKDYFCGDMLDKDLLSHIMVINHRGKVLFGKEIKTVFPEIESKYFIESIQSDVRDAKIEILNNPIYYILNLCRASYYLKENKVASKIEGAIWAKSRVDIKYNGLISSAIASYEKEYSNESFNQDLLIEFADFMLKEIMKS